MIGQDQRQMHCGFRTRSTNSTSISLHRGIPNTHILTRYWRVMELEMLGGQ